MTNSFKESDISPLITSKKSLKSVNSHAYDSLAFRSHSSSKINYQSISPQLSLSSWSESSSFPDKSSSVNLSPKNDFPNSQRSSKRRLSYPQNIYSSLLKSTSCPNSPIRDLNPNSPPTLIASSSSSSFSFLTFLFNFRPLSIFNNSNKFIKKLSNRYNKLTITLKILLNFLIVFIFLLCFGIFFYTFINSWSFFDSFFFTINVLAGSFFTTPNEYRIYPINNNVILTYAYSNQIYYKEYNVIKEILDKKNKNNHLKKKRKKNKKKYEEKEKEIKDIDVIDDNIQEIFLEYNLDKDHFKSYIDYLNNSNFYSFKENNYTSFLPISMNTSDNSIISESNVYDQLDYITELNSSNVVTLSNFFSLLYFLIGTLIFTSSIAVFLHQYLLKLMNKINREENERMLLNKNRLFNKDMDLKEFINETSSKKSNIFNLFSKVKSSFGHMNEILYSTFVGTSTQPSIEENYPLLPNSTQKKMLKVKKKINETNEKIKKKYNQNIVDDGSLLTNKNLTTKRYINGSLSSESSSSSDSDSILSSILSSNSSSSLSLSSSSSSSSSSPLLSQSKFINKVGNSIINTTPLYEKINETNNLYDIDNTKNTTLLTNYKNKQKSKVFIKDKSYNKKIIKRNKELSINNTKVFFLYMKKLKFMIYSYFNKIIKKKKFFYSLFLVLLILLMGIVYGRLYENWTVLYSFFFFLSAMSASGLINPPCSPISNSTVVLGDSMSNGFSQLYSTNETIQNYNLFIKYKLILKSFFFSITNFFKNNFYKLNSVVSFSFVQPQDLFKDNPNIPINNSNENDCSIGDFRSFFLGCYLLLAIPIFANFLGNIGEIVIEKLIRGQQQRDMKRFPSLKEFQFAWGLRKGWVLGPSGRAMLSTDSEKNTKENEREKIKNNLLNAFPNNRSYIRYKILKNEFNNNNNSKNFNSNISSNVFSGYYIGDEFNQIEEKESPTYIIKKMNNIEDGYLQDNDSNSEDDFLIFSDSESNSNELIESDESYGSKNSMNFNLNNYPTNYKFNNLFKSNDKKQPQISEYFTSKLHDYKDNSNSNINKLPKFYIDFGDFIILELLRMRKISIKDLRLIKKIFESIDQDNDGLIFKSKKLNKKNEESINDNSKINLPRNSKTNLKTNIKKINHRLRSFSIYSEISAGYSSSDNSRDENKSNIYVKPEVTSPFITSPLTASSIKEEEEEDKEEEEINLSSSFMNYSSQNSSKLEPISSEKNHDKGIELINFPNIKKNKKFKKIKKKKLVKFTKLANKKKNIKNIKNYNSSVNDSDYEKLKESENQENIDDMDAAFHIYYNNILGFMDNNDSRDHNRESNEEEFDQNEINEDEINDYYLKKKFYDDPKNLDDNNNYVNSHRLDDDDDGKYYNDFDFEDDKRREDNLLSDNDEEIMHKKRRSSYSLLSNSFNALRNSFYKYQIKDSKVQNNYDIESQKYDL